MKRTVIVLPLVFFLLCAGLNAADNMAGGKEQASVTSLLPVANSTTAVIAAGSPLLDTRSIEPQFFITHPYENARLPELGSTFVCGYAPPGSTLTVCGQKTAIHSGGGFLTMVKLSSGTFKMNAQLLLGTSAYSFARTIFVEGPSLPSPIEPLTIDFVSPNTDIMALPGDEIVVSARGSPGMEAFFTVKGVKKKFPMLETSAGRGTYNGIYVVSGKDKLRNSKVNITLRDPEKHGKINKTAAGLISLLPDTSPLIAKIAKDEAVLYVGPSPSKGNAADRYICVPKGTLLRVTGSKGEELRINLTKTKEAWVNNSSVKLLPAGTLPAQGIARNILVSSNERSASVRVPLGRKIPFEVQPDIEGKYIDIMLYGAYSNTDFMTYESTGIIEQVKWYQDDSQTLRVRAFTPNTKWWGYDARYDDDVLVLELRAPPPAPAGGKLPLEGLTIAVDAGHSEDPGATGVTGFLERDANLKIARILSKKLSGLGAKVIMTRKGNETVELYERPKIARQSHADIFVSVHNNALSYGGNPFIKNGYEIYYYHPSSIGLAREILAAYGEMVGTNSPAEYKLRNGGLRYGNLVITRTFQMPSVLTESCYMIVPREEAFLKTEKFQAACAEAMARGITRYAKQMRPIIKPAAKKPSSKKTPSASKIH